MSQTVLVAKSGRPTGSSNSRRLRAEGHIPGVLYGHGIAPISLSVERRDLRLALSGAAGTNTVLDLQVDGTSYPALVKELQRHPVKRTVSHIDFVFVSMTEEITVQVPLHITGEAKAVIADGGLVETAVETIEVITTPATIPTEFVVDITDMQMGDVIKLSSLKVPAGARLAGDPDLVIVSILQTAAGEAEAGGEGGSSGPSGDTETSTESD
jgi:large subunit ribosomal protein L25